MEIEHGPVYTRGTNYRARAEARQCAYRFEVLGVEHGQYGYMLSPDASDAGRNFIVSESFEAATRRREAGKGVDQRTFENMLSSQAMCFNLFAPLASRLDVATDVFMPFIDGLRKVTGIQIEYTPARDVLGDQSGNVGVDCDLLLEGQTAQGKLVQVIETKFVEPGFSVCGYRKAGRARKNQEVCPDDVPVRDDRQACLYVRNRGFGYWQRSDEHKLLAAGAFPQQGCPFGDGRWQLWVNHALAHEEAARRGASDVRLAVCASPKNTKLLGSGVLEDFRKLVQRPSSVTLMDLDQLIERIQNCSPSALQEWANGLAARYANI